MEEKINKKYNLEYLDYHKILSIDLWYNDNQILITQKKFLSLFRLFLGNIYRSFFSTPMIKVPLNKNLGIFYIRTFSRPDLAKHSEYYENIEGTTICILDKRKFQIDICNFFICIFLLLRYKKFWFKIFQDRSINFFSLKGLNIFLKLFSTFTDAIKIIPFLFNHKKFISFQEMLPIENFLCQIANKRKIETFALEHAIGFYKVNGYYWERYPINHYLNSVCKNILCWGSISKKIYEQHTNANISIIGKAGMPDIDDPEDGITFIFQSNKATLINKKLLDLYEYCKVLKIPCSLWFKEKNNLILDKDIRRKGPLRKIVIGCNTNFLLELGFLGLFVYVLEDSALKNLLPSNLIIGNNSSEVEKFLKTISYSKDIWNNFIECSGSESVKRYKKILNINY